jgi:DNA-binding XRE family transcriptional regulator
MVQAVETDLLLGPSFGGSVVRINKAGQPDGRTLAGQRTRNDLSKVDRIQILAADSRILPPGRLLTRLRIECGVDLEVLAQMAGLNPLTLSRIERGVERRHPLLKEDVVKIVGALGLNEDNPIVRLLMEKSSAIRSFSMHGRRLASK